MNAELLTSIQSRFRATPTFENQTLTLSLEGEADLDSNDDLGRVLEAMHDEIVRIGATTAILDLRRLDFLSSSGIRHFVTWFRAAAAVKPPSYRIRVMSSAGVPWQRRSLAAMSCFAPAEVLTIEAV
jgi:hypothetical protein